MPMHFTAMGYVANLMQGKKIEITGKLASVFIVQVCSEDCPDALRSHGKQRGIWKMVLH